MRTQTSDEIRAYRRAWYGKNKARMRKYQKQWHRKNLVKMRKYYREYQRKHRAKYPDRERELQRSHDLNKNYGISIAEYESLLKRQRGVCAVCKKEPIKRRLDVDHDHRTGKIRGLLCPNCNNGLGRFLDSVLLLRAAAKYLSKLA